MQRKYRFGSSTNLESLLPKAHIARSVISTLETKWIVPGAPSNKHVGMCCIKTFTLLYLNRVERNVQKHIENEIQREHHRSSQK